MIRTPIVLLGLSILAVGCQTVSQTTTPALYEIKQRLSDGTLNRCSSKDARHKKVRSLQLTNYQYAADNSGWVRADGSDQLNHLEGRSYLNVNTGDVHCSPKSRIPPNLPSTWIKLTEAKAAELMSGENLSGRRTIVLRSDGKISNSSGPNQHTVARPILPIRMNGEVECTDLRVRVPIEITTSMVEHNGQNTVKLWFRSEVSRYNALDHEHTLKCGLASNSCKGRFDNNEGDGYLILDDNLVRLELSSSGQTCVYRNN